MTTAASRSALVPSVETLNRISIDRFGDPTKRNEPSPLMQLLSEKGGAYEREVMDSIELRPTALYVRGVEEQRGVA